MLLDKKERRGSVGFQVSMVYLGTKETKVHQECQEVQGCQVHLDQREFKVMLEVLVHLD